MTRRFNLLILIGCICLICTVKVISDISSSSIDQLIHQDIQFTEPSNIKSRERNYGVKIIDCFLLLNEIDLLEIRLYELKDVVDYFVIVESNETFSGLPRKLIFKEHKNRLSKLNILDRIIHIECTYPTNLSIDHLNPDSTRLWEREGYNRQCMRRGIDQVGQDHDLVLIGDVDEIPDRHSLLSLKTFEYSINNRSNDLVIGFQQMRYHFNFHCRSSNMYNWHGTVLVSVDYTRRMQIQDIRNRRLSSNANIRLGYGGWHFSNFPFNDVHILVDKYAAWSHQEVTKLIDDPYQYWSQITVGDVKTNTQCEEDTLWLLPRYVMDNSNRYRNLLNAQQLHLVRQYQD